MNIGTSSAGQLGKDPSGSANYRSHIIMRHLFSRFFFQYVIVFSNNFAGNGSVNIGTSSAGQLGRDPSGSANYRSHIVRLNSIEPNTVMFSTKDYPILSDVSVPEIIDELEKQFDDKLCDLQGVRLVGANVYICLSRKDR